VAAERFHPRFRRGEYYIMNVNPLLSIHALVPAAGRSGRMGQPKQLLDAGGMPLLRATVEPLTQSGALATITIITRAEIAARLSWSAAAAPPPLLLFNEEPGAEMIDSIRLGLRERLARGEIAPRDGLLILAGDQPGLTAREILACIEAFRAAPGRILVAAHNGRRGHPAIFPAALTAEILAPGLSGGLRDLLRRHAALVTLLEISAAAARNLNTPADYAAFTNSRVPPPDSESPAPPENLS